MKLTSGIGHGNVLAIRNADGSASGCTDVRVELQCVADKSRKTEDESIPKLCRVHGRCRTRGPPA